MGNEHYTTPDYRNASPGIQKQASLEKGSCGQCPDPGLQEIGAGEDDDPDD